MNSPSDIIDARGAMIFLCPGTLGADVAKAQLVRVGIQINLDESPVVVNRMTGEYVLSGIATRAQAERAKRELGVEYFPDVPLHPF